MSPTGVDVVRAASQILPGTHYGSTDCAHRCHPEWAPHCCDCSGLTSSVFRRIGLVGADYCTGSFQQAIDSHRAGGGMSIEEARHTPGAGLWRGKNQGQGGIPGQDPGHVGISVGDGVHSLEARGHWAGNGLFLLDSLVWDFAGMFAGVVRASGPTTEPLPKPPPELEDPMGMVAFPPKVKGQSEIPTARAVKGFNFVLLENGARLKGDVAINDGTGRHWWAPPQDAAVANWQIIDVVDLHPVTGEHAIGVMYGFPNGDTGTYKAEAA